MVPGRQGFRFALLACLAAILALVLLPGPTSAQSRPAQSPPAQSQPAQSHDEMVVATHVAPPFAMKDGSGQWHGLAIDLWRKLAAEHDLKYRFQETDLTGMVEGVAAGRFDASVGALSITASREREVDFTQPYYTTGFGIVVRKSPPAFISLMKAFFTVDFLKAVGALLVLLLVVGVLFWLVERKRNSEEFGEGWVGIGSGLWFSAVTMTTVGYGDKAPRTALGKMIALVWMFAAIIVISTFTGMIASSLTAASIEGAVNGPDDLPAVTVGTVPGSASEDWLKSDRVGFTGFPTVSAGIAALREGRIDAFVYDAPILRYRVLGQPGSRDELRVLPGSFGRQDYGIALPQHSPLREPLDVSLLHIVESDAWRQQVAQVTGKRD